MRIKWIYGILILCVSVMMLMSNSSACNGIVWVFQANISLSPSVDSKDPEITGSATCNVLVITWEEGPVGSRDIYFSYSMVNGAAGGWILPVAPATHPDTSGYDERKPAVAVTRPHPVTSQEIHIFYEKERNGISEVWHAWTNNFGLTWTRFQISNPNLNAYNPACVYTEDLFGVPGGQIGWTIQIVWEQEVAVGGGLYEIRYAARLFDPTLPGPIFTRYTNFGGGVITSRISPMMTPDCIKPEIASADERGSPRYDVFYSVVWQQKTNLPGGGVQWNVIYDDGTLVMAIPARPIDIRVATLGSRGQINILGNQADAIEPDIATTQDYQPGETYFFHITYQFKMWNLQSPQQNSIESHYGLCAFPPTPGATSFTATLPPQGPGLIPYDNPTVASRFWAFFPPPSIFETWIAWEDSSNPGTAPDIFYTYGSYTVGVGWSGWVLPPTPVPYVGTAGVEKNPELWNRNDVGSLQTDVHLTFDDTVPANPAEITYIDP